MAAHEYFPCVFLFLNAFSSHPTYVRQAGESIAGGGLVSRFGLLPGTGLNVTDETILGIPLLAIEHMPAGRTGKLENATVGHAWPRFDFVDREGLFGTDQPAVQE